MSQISSDLKYQFKAMNIPAIGIDQLEWCSKYIANREGNCAVLLMHHNPLPTSNVDIRPYANLIDSGPFLLQCMENGLNTIILHGHTHCSSAFTLHPNEGDDNGGISTISNRGLSGGMSSEASIVEITTTDRNEFIKADVYVIERNSAMFQPNYKYPITNRYISYRDHNINLNKLPKNQSLTYEEVKDLLNVSDDSLAENLLYLEPRFLKISGKKQHFKNWRISRNN
ncbi:MAG: hypothetical protein DNFNHJIP_00740 [Candidatus Argoarchaeum ethanivorans]|uniref:Calcineurin-like phosphoesterase domain-containing protein n=1 Tax=Candidatus Argoarchaeum ethanivorans TaxID=2608793 RepID=A0A812A2W4_9EURY|nr:MAG: hypothetical protein DNFNHJIP_00740 [Candidatus Argoarchaeum ethanivorans]